MPAIRLQIISLMVFLYFMGYSQAGTWTWMKGDSLPYAYGNFGQKGVAASTNNPRSTYDPAYWTDTAGNFWVYGGGWLGICALWEFNPQTFMWTWWGGDSSENLHEMEDSTIIEDTAVIKAGKGIYDSLNYPGSLEYNMFTWVTPNNHLWLFGGQTGFLLNPVSCLWQYNPIINQWAWMGTFGPTNYGTEGVGDSTTMPGMRDEGTSAWTDNYGNLWFFGGLDSDGYAHNDMWEYNINTGIWCWRSGSSNSDDPGKYGIIGQPSVNNYPAARFTTMYWKDDSGNFWLVGGAQTKTDIMFQDIWRFNPQTLEWTWVKGIQGKDTASIGVDCSANTNYKDGPRYENSVWKVYDDFVITYGGLYDLDSSSGPNDLWGYKMSSNEWMKINQWPDAGSYGAQGIANAANYPPQRHGAIGFTDREGNLWLFGGQYYYYYIPGAYLAGYYNDLWKYVPDTACINAAFTSVQQVQKEEQVLLYPNPCAAASVQLAVGSELIGSRLALYDIQGQLVFTSAIRNPQSEIPVSGLAAGVYFVQVSSPNGGVVRKLVKAP